MESKTILQAMAIKQLAYLGRENATKVVVHMPEEDLEEKLRETLSQLPSKPDSAVTRLLVQPEILPVLVDLVGFTTAVHTRLIEELSILVADEDTSIDSDHLEEGMDSYMLFSIFFQTMMRTVAVQESQA